MMTTSKISSQLAEVFAKAQIDYCKEGRKIKAELSPASEEFAKHAASCGNCAVMLERERQSFLKERAN